MGAAKGTSTRKRANARAGEPSAIATNSFEKAAKRMREAGFDVGGRIEVLVEPRLEVGGYTIRGEGDRFRIVVSGRAVRSRMLEGLLLHEMSHIYRMRTGHPSHDAQIIDEAIGKVANVVVTEDYQRKILHDLVNNVEDLYADSIAWRVIRKAGLLTADESTAFIQGWVEDRPAESRDATRARWENAWSLANNARAIAQLERHEVPDTGGRAAALNDRLVSRLGPDARGHFEYFRNVLANLKDGITGDEYRALLIGYLGRFREATEPT